MPRLPLLSLLSLLILTALTGPARAQGQPITLKIASLAPKGSSWAKIFEKGGKEIEARTQGRVLIKYYFSGQQGDERAVVSKMAAGQLDGAAVTAVGLGMIKSDVRVLELPMLFSNDKQLDHVRNAMKGDFETAFDAAGYVLLAWGDVGWTQVFTKNEITSKQALQAEKMWFWKDDEIVKALFPRLGINGVPLGVPEVLTSLNTGAITGCYGSPLVVVSLQWFSKIRFGTNQAMNYAIGALVVRKNVFAQLSAEDQKVIREVGVAIGNELIVSVRKDSARAKAAMQKAGIKFGDLPAALLAEFEKQSQAVWTELTGKVYSKALLETLLKHRAEAKKKFP